jgi:hypothetical protein
MDWTLVYLIVFQQLIIMITIIIIIGYKETASVV